ncbi:MAG: histidine kinase dimerization/phosphoacceptor domain -containing protein [Phormidesmis sp.]
MPQTTVVSRASAAIADKQQRIVTQVQAALEDPAQSCLSILVVDDEPTARLLLRVAMQKEGFRVIEASNGVECLRLFKQEKPDIVLLDAVMPEMDGFSCCAALQDLCEKLSTGRIEKVSVPVLIITSLDDSQSVEQAFAAGATDYVTKPIHWNLLRHRVRGLRDSIKREQAEAEIKSSLKEKEALLKEIHHRVKNNLQIICSLLNLQSNAIEDEKVLSYFQDSQNRVRLMAMIHEKLYQSADFGKVELADYIRDLSSHLLRSYSVNQSDIRIDTHISGIFLEIDTAVSCGLIINELITNSLKYAFPDAIPGALDPSESGQSEINQIELNQIELNQSAPVRREIKIEARLTDRNHFSITYQDNGVGLPDDLDIENATTLGLQLVSSLTEQLDGQLTVGKGEKGCGAAFVFSELSLSN